MSPLLVVLALALVLALLAAVVQVRRLRSSLDALRVGVESGVTPVDPPC